NRIDFVRCGYFIFKIERIGLAVNQTIKTEFRLYDAGPIPPRNARRYKSGEKYELQAELQPAATCHGLLSASNAPGLDYKRGAPHRELAVTLPSVTADNRHRWQPLAHAASAHRAVRARSAALQSRAALCRPRPGRS